jgi:acyl-coenzyme A thioesterase PaaI-like protein
MESVADLASQSSDANRPPRTKQPNSLKCFVCGLENPAGLHMAFYDQADGSVVSETTVSDRYQGYPGVVHGGIIASMLDEVAGRASMQGDTTRLMMTAKLEVRYRKPIPIGQPLRLVGWLEKRRGRLTIVRGEVRLPDGSLGAEAEALLSDIPGDYSGAADFEQVGWRVYPDEASERSHDAS